MILSETMRATAEGKPISDHILPMTKACADEPLLQSFYNLRANVPKIHAMVPAEIALVQQRGDM